MKWVRVSTCLWLVCVVSIISRSAEATDADLHRVEIQILLHQYHAAEQALDSLETARPHDPAVHFRRAVLYFTWIDDYGLVDSLSGHFHTAIDSTILAAEEQIRIDPGCVWGYYYLGSGRVYRAFFRRMAEGVNIGNLPSLLADATGGIGELKKAYRIDTTLADVTLTIGNYHHWKGRNLPWPLGKGSEAEQGIAMMEEAIAAGVSSQEGAVQALASVYIAEHRYEDAVALLEPYRRRYPSSRLLGDPVGRALLKLERYGEAGNLFSELLNSASAADRTRPVVQLQLERWIAYARARRGDCETARRIVEGLRALDYTGTDERWLRIKLSVLDRALEPCR